MNFKPMLPSLFLSLNFDLSLERSDVMTCIYSETIGRVPFCLLLQIRCPGKDSLQKEARLKVALIYGSAFSKA